MGALIHNGVVDQARGHRYATLLRRAGHPLSRAAVKVNIPLRILQ
jgi:hypothetical protein